MSLNVLLLTITSLFISLPREGNAQYSPDEKLNIISVNGVAVLKCGAKGALFCISQEPGIQWLNPRGEAVGPRDPSRHVHVEEVPGQLVLVFNDPKLSDNGTWTCQARDMERTIQVFVVDEVQFDVQNQLETPTEGATVTLKCSARGTPRPRLSWYKNGVLMTGTRNPMKYDVWEGEMAMRRVNRKDSGEYECRAVQHNDVWNHTASAFTRVLVRHGPIMKQSGVQKLYVLYDRIRTIRCSATAFPKPSYRWSHTTARGVRFVPGYSGDVFSARNGSYSDLTVRVNGQDDLGEYVCYAKNAHGANKTRFHLIKARKPSPPTKVVFDEEGSSSNTLIFRVECDDCIPLDNITTPSGAGVAALPEIGYRFELAQQMKLPTYLDAPPVYWEEDRDRIVTIDVPRTPDAAMTSVGGLPPNTTFVARVATLNLAGTSDYVELKKQMSTKAAAAHFKSQAAFLLIAIIVHGLAYL